MISKVRNFLFVAVLFVSCPTWAKAEVLTDAPLIPIKDFFRNPDKVGFKLSKDGKHIALMQPWKNRMNIFVKGIDSGEPVRLTDVEERDINKFVWCNNQRIVYALDKGGDENFRLYAIDIDGSNRKSLTPFDGVKAQILDDLEDNDNEMVIGLNKRDPKVFDVYRLNVYSGELRMITENPGGIVGWQTDHNGNVRVAVKTDGTDQVILYRDREDQAFEEIARVTYRDTLDSILFTFDNKNLYMIWNKGRDKSALVLFDPKRKQEIKEIYKRPDVDLGDIIYSRKRRMLTGVEYMTWRTYRHFFDGETEKMFKNIERLLPDRAFSIVSFNKEEDVYTVYSFSDRSRMIYYIYDSKTKRLTEVGNSAPWLKEDDLAAMKPVAYKSRDGLTINGYLTLPRGSKGKMIPIVVNPHGGPWYRDEWTYHTPTQFLANRGYAVFQLNFRGSTGYGRKFLEAGYKQWGKSMQDDITDGVKWLVKKGIADPKRICIYGGSYGGYATLAGLAFTPDLYACGVDVVGVANLFTFLDTIPPYWEPMRDMWYERVGHPEKDKELLKAASPVFHVDKIKAPLLIAQGAKDPRVKKSESDQMVAALKARGVDVPYIVKENEGHGFNNEENRLELYGEIEKFLAKHLGGRLESVK